MERSTARMKKGQILVFTYKSFFKETKGVVYYDVIFSAQNLNNPFRDPSKYSLVNSRLPQSARNGTESDPLFHYFQIHLLHIYLCRILRRTLNGPQDFLLLTVSVAPLVVTLVSHGTE